MMIITPKRSDNCFKAPVFDSRCKNRGRRYRDYQPRAVQGRQSARRNDEMSEDYTGFIWDAFISHASEDKKGVARPLANLLAAAGFKIWLDEGELTLGDSIREKIDHGLANSRFAVLVLSKRFFGKRWPKAELDGVFALEQEGNTRILPVWHGVDHDDIKVFSPILASRLGVRTEEGLAHVRDEIVRSIKAKCVGRRRDQPLFHGRLTKKVLFSIPERSIFATNAINPDRTPLIAAQLEGEAQREDLWQQVKALEGTGRVCFIFRDWAAYRDHMASRSMWESEADAEQSIQPYR